MRILHVCETMRGGVGTYLNLLIGRQLKELKDSKINLIGPKEHAELVTDVPANMITLFSRRSRLLGLVCLAMAFTKAVSKNKPDIIHIHSTFAGAVVRPIAKLFSIPVIYCPHGWAVDREQGKLIQSITAKIECLLSKWTKYIIAVSQHEYERGIEIGIAPEKLIVIPNGLDVAPPDFSPVLWDDKRLRVLFVGRLDRQKGIDVLFKAVTGMEEDLSVRVIGEAVVAGEKLEFSKHKHVEHLGWLDGLAVAAHMAAADVIVVPSRWEGFGLVAVEAMRLKKAVIASRVGGLQSIIIDKKTGYLFDSEKAQQLATLLKQANKEELKKLGENGYKIFVENYTASDMTSAVLKLYK